MLRVACTVVDVKAPMRITELCMDSRLSYPSVQSMMRYVGALAAVLPHSVLETICIMIALALTKRANENEAYLIKGCSIKSSAPRVPMLCTQHSDAACVPHAVHHAALLSLVAVRGFAHICLTAYGLLVSVGKLV